MPELWEGGKKAAKASYKLDAPLAAFVYVREENKLTDRVEQARKLGLSYGKYMAQLHEGLIEDPMKNE